MTLDMKHLRDSLQQVARIPLRHLEYHDDFGRCPLLHASFILTQWDLYDKFDPLISRIVQRTSAKSLAEVASHLVFPDDSLHHFVKEVQIMRSPMEMGQLIHITFAVPDLYKFSTMVERAARAKFEAEFNTQIEQVLRDGR